MCSECRDMTADDRLVVGDLEGLCQVPFKENYLYLAQEYPPTILEWNEVTEEVSCHDCHDFEG